MTELLHKLGIDWRLLIAQIVNFVILFFILKRVAYGPILRILTERRARIAKGMSDAERAERRLKDVELERAEVLHRADAERRALLEAAAAEAEVVRPQRMAAAEAEATATINRSRLEANRLRQGLLDEVRREVGDLVFSIARKVTAEKIPASAHDAIARAAVDEL
ncbi:MAG: F0F1 ATP synthase subunit B, partial [Acidobacteriota bacterium]